MGMSLETERDVLVCALEEALHQVEETRNIEWKAPNPNGVVAQVYLVSSRERHETWKKRVARIQLAIENIDTILADERAQIVQQWSPP
jgi:thymidylate synthase